MKNEEGTEEVLVCCQMLEPVPATTLRAAAAVEASAQPSWLLDRAGRPFFANAAATKHLADRGEYFYDFREANASAMMSNSVYTCNL